MAYVRGTHLKIACDNGVVVLVLSSETTHDPVSEAFTWWLRLLTLIVHLQNTVMDLFATWDAYIGAY